MKVLAALDFGDSALEALRQARELAHGLNAQLAACHVLPPVHDLAALFPEGSLPSGGDALEEEQRARLALTGHVRDKLGLELTDLFIERGVPYAQVLHRGEAWKADYIVVGTHGGGGLSRVLLGSAAERIVRHAHCSVLVARPSASSGVVLVATDLSDPSLPAISTGAAAARRANARLVVASALEWSGFMASPVMGLIGAVPTLPPLEVQNQVREALKITLQQAMTNAGAVGEARVLNGAAADEVVRCAGELNAELIVVGTHGRTGLERFAVGSVAERIIRHAPCSVLSVRLAKER